MDGCVLTFILMGLAVLVASDVVTFELTLINKVASA